jgi:hypothetical protein
VVTDVWRRFELEADGRRRAVKLDGAKVAAEQKQELWARLVAISQSAIEPRLRNEALEQLQRYGEPVAIGRITLSREGFAWRGPLRQKRYPWSEHHRTFFNTDRIRVLAQSPGESVRTVADIGTEIPNAVLLPRLMSVCVEAFVRR